MLDWGDVHMGRKPNKEWTVRIKYVPTPDAAQRYARALEILLRAKQRMEMRKRHGNVEEDTVGSDGNLKAE